MLVIYSTAQQTGTTLTANVATLVIRIVAVKGRAQVKFKSILQSTLYALSKISVVNVSSECRQSPNSSKFIIGNGRQRGLAAISLYLMPMQALKTK